MESVTPAAISTERPITIANGDHACHIVHGVYGSVSVNARRHAHATFTWAEALPNTVRLDFMNAETGTELSLYINRDLLRHGGKPHNVKVDYAGNLVFIEVSGPDSASWVAFDNPWFEQFLETTYAITDRASDDQGR